MQALLVVVLFMLLIVWGCRINWEKSNRPQPRKTVQLPKRQELILAQHRIRQLTKNWKDETYLGLLLALEPSDYSYTLVS